MTDPFDFHARANRFAVMGNPVAHSQSPRIHQMFAHQFDIKLQYDRIQVDAGGFEQAVSHFVAHGGTGLNVTVPFKVDAWRLCAQGSRRLSARAQRAQAVNTLRFARDRSLDSAFGDNTDGAGLVRDIEGNLGRAIEGARVLILGAGGAARGVLGPLLARKPSRLLIANRTARKAHDLAAHHADDDDDDARDGVVSGCHYDRLGAHFDESPFDIIINATAASLASEVPPIDARCIGDGALVYDMMYAPTPTAFMRWALAHGATARDGLGMLVEQAAESFHLWHDRRPETASVIDALRATMENMQ